MKPGSVQASRAELAEGWQICNCCKSMQNCVATAIKTYRTFKMVPTLQLSTPVGSFQNSISGDVIEK